jgi:hypothetical protein
MADQQLNIKLNVIDNASKAFTGVKNSIFNLRNALIGLGGGVALRGLTKVGSEAELTENKLSFLFGSVEKGSQAFKTLNSFASKSPFAFQDIISSAGNLAIVSKDTEELARNLQIVGNVSAITGLDFQTSAEQISKAFTKGINSARLFQDKGVASLLGFQKGADVSAFATEEAFNRVFGTGGRFAQASNVLSNTFQGTLTKITNSFVKFQNDINKGGFFNFISAGLSVINDNLDKNSATLQKFANLFGEQLTKAIKGLLLGTGLVIDAITPIFKFVASGIEGLLKILDALPSGVRELGVIGFLLLGTGGKLIALAVGSLLTAQKKFIENFSNEKFFNFYGLLEESTKEIDKQSGAYGVIKEFLNEIDLKTQSINEKNQQKNELINNTNSGLEKQVSLLDEIIEKFGRINTEALDQLKKTSDIVVQTLNQGIKDFSKGIAQSIVLGKSLGEALKSAVQNALVNILATQIEILIREGLKLAGLKLQTLEISKQNALLAQRQAMGGDSGGGLFGSLLKIGASFFGGGGGFNPDIGGIPDTYVGMAEGGSVRGGMPITVGERGRELFVPNTNGTIIPNHDMGNGMNITFNIQANDVRGIKELLIDNRATIINLVNQGANQKGKSNIV